jgi:8-oxo-dGTP pyrophosphatase MutT (NUDIX family)
MADYTLNILNCSGGVFLAKATKRFLLLQRTQLKTRGSWGLVGGKHEKSDASPLDALTREISEELGNVPKIDKIIPLDLYSSGDKLFNYNTYIILIENEFIPILNSEHSSYAWCSYNNWPKPLHSGVNNTFNNKITKGKLELLLNLI